MADTLPAAPQLEFATTIAINLGKADGTVTGPMINGIVIPASGGDFPWLRPDGVIAATGN
ncbi:MAG: hypothetical protein ABI821_06030 [Pseudomonadota bacterium]